MSTATATAALPPPPAMFPSEKPLYICSIYPDELRHMNARWRTLRDEPVFEQGRWQWFRNVTNYIIPAVPKGEHRVLRITPAVEYVTVPYPGGESGELGPRRSEAPISAEQIRKSLLQIWLGGMYTGEGTNIGVGPIAGEDPTEREKQELIDIQTRHFRRLVNKGTELMSSGTPHLIASVQAPSSRYRLAANWLGADVAWNREWEAMVGAGTKSCIACTKPIPVGSLACEHCNRDLIVFAQTHKWDAEKVRGKGDEIVAAELEALAEPAAPKVDRTRTLRENARLANAQKQEESDGK